MSRSGTGSTGGHSSLSVLYVLLFHIDQDGEEEEEGIFSCHDEDGSPLSFIIAFCMFCRWGVAAWRGTAGTCSWPTRCRTTRPRASSPALPNIRIPRGCLTASGVFCQRSGRVAPI